MSEVPAGQEAGVEEVTIPTDEEYALMTEEQRNADLMGGEIEWTDEQNKALGKDVPGPVQQPATQQHSAVEQLDRQIQAESLVSKRAEQTPSHQKLRRRAQTAEEKAKALEDENARIIAENKAYKDTIEKLGPEKEYDLNDPDDLDQYLKDKKAELSEPGAPPQESEFEVLPDEVSAAEEGPRFVGEDGTVYDGKLDNPTGKPYFRVKDKAGTERVVFDREALTEYDDNMVARFGEKLYMQMWGTPQRPGVMAFWRDKAPTHEVMAVLNANDPVVATLQVFRNIVSALAHAQQKQQQPGQQPQTQQPPRAPAPQKDVRQAPRGFGAQPITDSDIRVNKPTASEVTDKQVSDMSEDERNAWLLEE